MRRIHAEDGAAAVEFALVLPVLILLVFGIIEFGLVFNRWLSVTHAAREGVRTYSLTGDAALGATAGEDSAPDLAGEINCVGTAPNPSQVTMVCTTLYDLELLVFQTDLEIASAATMRKE